MAEEIETASIVIPRSMIASVGFNGLLGFAMVMVTLFSLGDLDTVSNTPTQFPYMQVFVDSVGSTGGASAMVRRDQSAFLRGPSSVLIEIRPLSV